MIRSVVAATRKRYVMMNVRAESISDIESIIPGADSPTVISLADEGMYAMHSVVDADEMWRVLPALEAAGASAILVLPIEQMIP
jgi:ATP phosphoribosyltransferase